MGDGGASWRARQLHRVREKAKRDGTNVEELAHEHFGSVSQMKREISEKRRNHRDRNRAATGGRGCSPARRLPDPLRSPRAQCEGAFSSEYSPPPPVRSPPPGTFVAGLLTRSIDLRPPG